jgi:hypothetical protein
MRARNYNLGSTFAADATILDVLSANKKLKDVFRSLPGWRNTALIRPRSCGIALHRDTFFLEN